MEVLFVSGFGPIVPNFRESVALYRDIFGLPLQPVQGQTDYFHSEAIGGVKHFALWPLSRVALSCFGSTEWPAALAAPQSWIEFEVADIVEATETLKRNGLSLLVENRTEPWGQTVTRFLSPENMLVSLTITPWMRTSATAIGAMKPRIKAITLAVSDLQRSVAFYQSGLGLPTRGIVGQEHEYGAVAFFELDGGLILGLYPDVSLAHGANIEPTLSKAGAMSLGHGVASREEVDRVMGLARRAGARVVAEAADAFWGGYSGYFQDPDGHLWEVLWNPHWNISPD